ncbi:MAG: ATP-binding cassette domain-containing protein [Bacteroidia bacterium]|nr:ATP-binding cassette domain-containing protein [Bacteroidia bacterium]
MISISNLSVSFGKNQVLKGLNLELAEGQIHGLVGLNGSGKSTFFNAVYGLVTPKEGSLRFGDHDLHKTDIGYLETVNCFYPRMRGREYLQLFQLAKPGFNIQGWNELFGLPLEKLTEHYSTGMKKKLAFLGILCLDKPIMLLDEPFNGLDLETNQLLRQILFKLREKGKTMLITSHIFETLTSTCDTLSYLKEGKIVFSSPRADFAEAERRIFELENKSDQISALLDR